jgi:hypothetical protein
LQFQAVRSPQTEKFFRPCLILVFFAPFLFFFPYFSAVSFFFTIAFLPLAPL